MKLWELSSYFRAEPKLLKRVVHDPKWVDLAAHFYQFSQLVERQDRAVLDMQLPTGFCRQALKLTNRKYVLDSGRLCECTGAAEEQSRKVLTALQVFDLHGGECLEAAQEYGSCHVPLPAPKAQAILILEAVQGGDLLALEKAAENIDFQRNREMAAETLISAIEHEQFLVADLLLRRGVDINVCNARGESALWHAVFSGNLKCVTYLLEHGASVDVVSPDDNSMLHCSIDAEVEIAISKTDQQKQHVPASDEITRLLIQFGAKVQFKNAKGELPIDWAIERRHRAAEAFLREVQKRLGIEDLITIIPTAKKQAIAALCLAQFCATKNIHHSPVRKLIEHLLSVLVTTNIVKWGDGDIRELVPAIWPSLESVLPSEVSKGEFRELVDAVVGVGESNMYTGPWHAPLEELRRVIRMVNEFGVPIPRVDPDFYLRGNVSLGEADGWGENVDAETYQKIRNVYEKIMNQ